MTWNKNTKTLTISYQDLEHIVGDWDFDKGLDGELFYAGLRDMNDKGINVKDIDKVVIIMKRRTIWAKGTPREMLKIHKGEIEKETKNEH